MTTIGALQTIARYPVKSMRGEELASSAVGFQGLPGDRGFAFVQAGRYTTFPWLTGRDYQGLFGYQPVWESAEGKPRLFVRTGSGARLPIESNELREELERAAGMPLRLHSDHRGNQDVAHISLMFASTIRALAEAGGVRPDHRRFRMNFIVANGEPAFAERELVGKTLRIGDALIVVTHQDQRCVMITFDPETGGGTPAVLKAVGQMNEACAGVYASVLRAGTASLGDAVELLPSAV